MGSEMCIRDRNVAVLGLPMILPVMASTASTESESSSVSNIISVPDITPIRLAIKAGVTLHKTVF